MGKLKTGFTYTATELMRNEVNFIDSLTNTLLKGGETDSNCAIVMTMVGAIVGYNSIPSYFRHKIANYTV